MISNAMDLAVIDENYNYESKSDNIELKQNSLKNKFVKIYSMVILVAIAMALMIKILSSIGSYKKIKVLNWCSNNTFCNVISIILSLLLFTEFVLIILNLRNLNDKINKLLYSLILFVFPISMLNEYFKKNNITTGSGTGTTNPKCKTCNQEKCTCPPVK